MRDFKGKHVHFIGIGGISMRGLAELLHAGGAIVSGSDRDDSPTLDMLRGLGITVYAGHDAAQVEGADYIVYNSAIHAGNPEYDRAQALGIPFIKRSELLGEIMTDYDVPIVISGAHGKTTVTGLTATVFEACGTHPTVHNGGVMPLYGGAHHVGDKQFFIAEGCEYMENFLDFHPKVAVLLNIDADHLDYYRDIDHITSSFAKYVSLLPGDGLVIANGDDVRCVAVAQGAPCPYITFGQGEGCDYRAENITQSGGCFSFDVAHEGGVLGRATAPIPGEHNIYNALAAIVAGLTQGLDFDCIINGLAQFQGNARRMEKTGTLNGAQVYHDYAHHPAEIRAMLKTASLMGYDRVICVHQPHTYTRTKELYSEYLEAFDDADILILLDIFAAREVDPGDISSAQLAGDIAARGISEVHYAPSFEAAAALCRDIAGPGDIILTLGAGNIDQFNKLLNMSAD